MSYRMPPSISDIKSLLPYFIIILISISIADPAEITICLEGCDFTNISLAVDASQPGDILEVYSGTYPENIIVNKSITLKGIDAGAGLPVIDAHGLESAITLEADGINLSGFNITGALYQFALDYAGINVLSNNNTITGNSVLNNENGILLRGSNNFVKGNNITSDYLGIYGIRVDRSYNNSIESNYIGKNSYGLYIVSSQGNYVRNNTAAHNTYGIILESSTNNSLKANQMLENDVNFDADGVNNIIPDNLIEGRPIIYLVGASDEIIDSSWNAGTVYCIDCSNVTIRDLMITNNKIGIYLYNTTNSTLENNTLTHNDYGTVSILSHMNLIKDNIFENNSIEGLYLQSSDDNTLEKNRASNNSNGDLTTGSSGISLFDSYWNWIAMNDIRGNRHGLSLNYSDGCVVMGSNIDGNSRSGIFVFHSNNSTIYNNNIYSNPNGIWLVNASMNNITTNDIYHNEYGVLLYFSQNNTIRENSFVSNTAGIADDPNPDYINILGPNNMIDNVDDRTSIVSERVSRGPGAVIRCRKCSK